VRSPLWFDALVAAGVVAAMFTAATHYRTAGGSAACWILFAVAVTWLGWTLISLARPTDRGDE
jgi:hypothetical protein